MGELRAELKCEISGLTAELKADVHSLRADVASDLLAIQDAEYRATREQVEGFAANCSNTIPARSAQQAIRVI